jgi:hypothetical protein
MTRILAIFAALFAANVGVAGDYLSSEQVKEQFIDKTFDGVYLPKNKRFSTYSGADGALKVVRPNGKTDPARSWFVKDDGQRCVTHPRWKNHSEWADGRCAWVKDAGNGEIHQFSPDGEHTHIFTNFRDGDQT